MINSKFTNLSNNLFYGGLYAIYSTYSNNSFIEKNKFLSSSSSAILTNYAHNVLVNDNYFVNDSYAAIAIDGANNSFQNLFINQSNRGIRVSYERNDLIYNVTIFNCTSGASLKEGISLQLSGNVRVINNSINLANTGIIVDSGGNHTISGNIIQNLISGYGINLGYSKNTSIYNNRVTNTSVGIYVSDNLNGSIYNNYFNNSVNFQFYNYAGYLYNDWNTTLRTGTNIAGGSQICGNVYVTPSGSGISQTCTDSVAPLGICDSGYSLQIYNYDSCPLKI
jgi:parallel beta-helix repeat protein